MAEHHHVPHPNHLMMRPRSLIGRINAWLAGHLAMVFGLVWTVWLFMAIPLIALLLPTDLQARIFFLSSGWIQLWALPLFIWVGNRLQRSSDAQSDAQHQALTHIAIVEDQNRELLAQNTELTQQIHVLVSALKEDESL